MTLALDDGDELLRRRLLRANVVEAGLCLLVCAGLVALYLPGVVSTVAHGELVLWVGRGSRRLPVVLTMAQSPGALVGTLIAGLGLLLLPVSRLVACGYQIVRHAQPQRGLPRVPTSLAFRAFDWLAFPGFAWIMALGGVLAIGQFVVALSR